MKRVKITEDGYVWKIVTEQEARTILYDGSDELYGLYDDDTESLITDKEQLDEHISAGRYIGTAVGFIEDEKN